MSNSIQNNNESRVTIIDRENDVLPVQHLSGDFQGLTIGATDPSHSYVQLLADTFDNFINSSDCKMAVGETSIFRYHREGEAPMPIIVPSLSSRSVTVNMRDPYTNNEMPTKLTSPQGSTIVSKPSKDALMFSLAIERFDGDCDGTITALSIQQEVESIVEQVDREVTKQIFEALVKGDELGNKYYTIKPVYAGSLAVGPITQNAFDIAEDHIYEVARHMHQMGTSLEDFAISMAGDLYNIFERQARRAGFKASDCENVVSAYLGTEVFKHVETNAAHSLSFFMMPKRHVAVSFREREDGTVFDTKVTRNGNRQSTSLEIYGVADLLIDGFTQARNDATGAIHDVKLPLLTKGVLTSDGSPGITKG